MQPGALRKSRQSEFPEPEASMSERLSDADLQEIDAYLTSGETGPDNRVNGWLRRLSAEVRESRSGASGEDSPQKRHGDALADGSGTRHGEHDIR